jgi:hypothetical protein
MINKCDGCKNYKESDELSYKKCPCLFCKRKKRIDWYEKKEEVKG